MEISPKWLVVQGAVAFTCTFGYALYSGRQYAKTKDTVALNDHHSGLVASVWMLVLTVALIYMVRNAVGATERPGLFLVHLPLVLTAVGIAAAMALRFDGLRSQKVHGFLGYASAACFGLGLITGLHMLWQM